MSKIRYIPRKNPTIFELPDPTGRMNSRILKALTEPLERSV